MKAPEAGTEAGSVAPDDHTTGEDPAAAARERFHRLRQWRDGMRANPATRRIWRIGVGVLGTAVVAGGLVLVPFPGPGWLIVIFGLAILASEYEWAQRLLDFVRDNVRAWTRWLGRQPIWVRALVGLGTALLVAGVLWGVFAVLGVPSWVPDAIVPPLPGLD